MASLSVAEDWKDTEEITVTSTAESLEVENVGTIEWKCARRYEFHGLLTKKIPFNLQITP